jgi:DNA-directed RNA polymerase specialized sigma24 family protein
MVPVSTTQRDRVTTARDRNAPGRDSGLAELCRAYWYPVYALIRCQGFPPDDAADLTQDFFARLLAGGRLGAAGRGKERLRDLLWKDCHDFLADRRGRTPARERGGDLPVVSLNVGDAEQRFRLEPGDRLDPERRFERDWALGVLDRTLERLSVREEEAGRGASFRELLAFLIDGPRVLPHSVVARRNGISEGAVKAAVRRLRGRYRAALLEEVARTLEAPSEADVDDELRALFAALGP